MRTSTYQHSCTSPTEATSPHWRLEASCTASAGTGPSWVKNACDSMAFPLSSWIWASWLEGGFRDRSWFYCNIFEATSFKWGAKSNYNKKYSYLEFELVCWGLGSGRTSCISFYISRIAQFEVSRGVSLHRSISLYRIQIHAYTHRDR